MTPDSISHKHVVEKIIFILFYIDLDLVNLQYVVWEV